MGSPGNATTSGCRVDLIGGFRLRFHDRVVELPLGAQRLLSYLALKGSWVTRATPRRCCGRIVVGARPPRTSARPCGGRADKLAMTLSGLRRADWLWLTVASTCSMSPKAGAHRRLCQPDAELPAANAETISRLSMRLLPGCTTTGSSWQSAGSAPPAWARGGRWCCPARPAYARARGEPCGGAIRSYSAKAPTGSSSVSSQRATGELRWHYRTISECSAVS